MEGRPLALKFVEELLRSLATWTALADKDFDIRLFTDRPERLGEESVSDHDSGPTGRQLSWSNGAIIRT